MKKTKLLSFRKFFEAERTKLVAAGGVVSENIISKSDEPMDEVDQATLDTDTSIRLRLKNREIGTLRRIEVALRRIEDGTFGECEECGSDIELRRLEARPTATLCVACKEEQERKGELLGQSRAFI